MASTNVHLFYKRFKDDIIKLTNLLRAGDLESEVCETEETTYCNPKSMFFCGCNISDYTLDELIVDDNKEYSELCLFFAMTLLSTVLRHQAVVDTQTNVTCSAMRVRLNGVNRMLFIRYRKIINRFLLRFVIWLDPSILPSENVLDYNYSHNTRDPGSKPCSGDERNECIDGKMNSFGVDREDYIELLKMFKAELYRRLSNG